MMFKLAAILLAVVFCLPACTTTYDLSTSPRESHPWMEIQFQTYREFQTNVKGKTVRIIMTNGQHEAGRITRADADSIGWSNASGYVRHIVPTSDVQSLEIRTNYAFYGLALGVLGPTILFAVNDGFNAPPAGNEGAHDYSRLTSSVLTVLVTGGLGAAAGSLIVHTDQYLVGTPGSADTTQSR